MSPRQAAAYAFLQEKREIRTMLRELATLNVSQSASDKQKEISEEWMNEL